MITLVIVAEKFRADPEIVSAEQICLSFDTALLFSWKLMNCFDSALFGSGKLIIKREKNQHCSALHISGTSIWLGNGNVTDAAKIVFSLNAGGTTIC